METLRRDFLDRNDEVKQIISFIKNSELDEGFRNLSNNGIRQDIKASVIIMLYNEIESTITASIKKIHTVVFNGTFVYSELSEKLRLLLVKYYLNSFEKSNDNLKADFCQQYIEEITDRAYICVSYENLVKWYSLYSGNLDSKEICAVLDKYGITVDVKKKELQTIKTKRNQLSHGQFSFEEIGRDLSYQQLEVMQIAVEEVLTNVIDKIQDYIDQEDYLACNRGI